MSNNTPIYYNDELNVQILIALLKNYEIKRIIVSPGTTNIEFIKSLQNDPYFKVFSEVDERAAAYLATGLAAETGEPVMLSCTGATASRNYFSGLTEAYYRKLPILAITSTQAINKVGHNIPQVIDRSIYPVDTVKYSVTLRNIKNSPDEIWETELLVNKALLELSRDGGGPVHINLETSYSTSFTTKKLHDVKKVNRYTVEDVLPDLPKVKIGILLASHIQFSELQIQSIEKFCEVNNAVVFCDHTSGYKGKYSVIHSIVSSQRLENFDELKPELLIHIGNVNGDYSVRAIIGSEVWRVSEDGELIDTYKKLKNIFEMSFTTFFDYYSQSDSVGDDTYLKNWEETLKKVRSSIPEIPFSNIWMAQQLHDKFPKNSVLHLSILNSLRSWNFFELSESVRSYSNVGGFGIDGCLPSLIGASFADKNKLYFGVIGDLSFFYGMNVLGNRQISNNVRILMVNNGVGTEFKNFNHAASEFKNDADYLIAAKGHYGDKSPTLVKNFSENLGFEYVSASTKDDFNKNMNYFIESNQHEKPLIFEVFTNDFEESEALEIVTSIFRNKSITLKHNIKKAIGKKNINKVKKILGK